ncbi:thiamine phosphate synthase [Emcibacteraceae bacterium Y4]|nr:thiamine phosphate synthase [Pseudemcibacter aquimaris]
MTDKKAQPLPEEVIERMPSGSMVILRDYDHENRAELAKALCYICRVKGIKFMVAGDLTLALMVQADGIHLPEYMLDQIATIKRENPDFTVTVSAHDHSAVRKAEKSDADGVLLAPVFPTYSHPETFDDPSKTIGTDKLANICAKQKIAIYALGGINIDTALSLKDTGIAGIAAIRGI